MLVGGGGGQLLLCPCPFGHNLGKNVVEGGHDQFRVCKALSGQA